MTGFTEAFAAHQAGRFAEAERGYRAVLAAAPQHADAWHLLGVLAQQQGRLEEAVANITKAIALAGQEPVYLTNLGITLSALGRNSEAADALERAAARDPKAVGTLFALGNALRALGRFAAAEQRYRQAIALAPTQATLHNNLGTTLKDLGRLGEAEAATREAIRLEPGHARAQYNLGVILKDSARPAEAADCFRRAIAALPDFPEAHANLAVALHDLGDLDGAIQHGRRAVALNPRDALAFNNLGAALRDSGHFDDAMACYRQALALDPNLAAARHNEGVALERAGRADEALTRYQAARDQASGGKTFAEAELNAALLLLARGEFTEGWKAYEARWHASAERPRDFPQPVWQGEKDGGVLVWGEQGLGDQILYAGMIPDLLARGQAVVLETEPRLVPLFARSFPGAHVVAVKTPPDPATTRADIRWQSPLAGLGRWLRPDAARFPARRAYLVPDAARRADFRASLSRLPGDGPIVGVSWVSRNAKIGVNKTLALADWASLLKLPGLRLVDLQYGDTQAERAAVTAAQGINIHHFDDLDLYRDIDGVAALAAACDFVISVSSVTAHLAAAGGTPTWVLVPAATGNLWYWMHKTDHTPWYPAVRMFRQARAGDWSGVIDRVTQALRATREGN